MNQDETTAEGPGWEKSCSSLQLQSGRLKLRIIPDKKVARETETHRTCVKTS